ncbi:MAG: guanylate kinase [Anaerolineae bacterium]|nr:guanylate kinase [Anaerolineae bacterium]
MTHIANSSNVSHHEPLLIVISGPSGVGKDSVVQRMKKNGLPFHFVITATTRPPRTDEQHGIDYFFYSKSDFAEMIEQDELIEYAYVYNDYKGIPKTQVRAALDSGKDVVMRLDVQGASTIKRLYPDVMSIFLTTDTEEELVDRLKSRKTESNDQLKLRIATARKEMQRVRDFDYVVINRDEQLDQTVAAIKAIIHAEHHRVNHRKISI